MLKKAIVPIIVFVFASCEGPEGPIGPMSEDGSNSLIRTTLEPIGSNCLNGGFKIEAGSDVNINEVLDDDEVSATSFVCNGENSLQDQQLRLLLAASGTQNGVGTSNTAGDFFGLIIKFDKRNYPEVNSIVFSPHVFNGNSANQTFVELYNITDDVVIVNSTLSPSSTAGSLETAEILESANLFDDLPEKEITLSIRLRSSDIGTSIFLTGESYLIMERD